MKISLIVAVAENLGIGKNNELLWQLPADMLFFKETTKDHHIITGRKNYESIPPKFRPLPNRTNCVITRQIDYKAEGAHVFSKIQEAIDFAKKNNENELFVIGGGEIYKQILQHFQVDCMYITRVHARIDADTFFPSINENEWNKSFIKKQNKDEKHAFEFEIYRYERK